MILSYSRVDSFKTCPYKWKLHYIDELETIDKCDPQDALKLGTCVHESIETNVDDAIRKYMMSYPIIEDRHVNEEIKIRGLIPKVMEILPPHGMFEMELSCDDFKGFIDYLVPTDGDWTKDDFDIYDFKYSNNVDRYMESAQLHVYKYFAEKLWDVRINNLYFVFVPKTMIRQKKTEDLFQFRERLRTTVADLKPEIRRVEYDPNKVIDFMIQAKHVIESETYEKHESRLCDWCDYKDFCQKGDKSMLLPKNERVEINSTRQIKGWIYGQPFSGKTTFLDNAPDPLNLNTDGNVNNVTMQRIRIRDTYEGRVKKFGWEVFKEVIDELEKGSEFKTIIVDLVEDTREMCRVFMYDKLGIQHESDSGFGKGWDIIKTEYLSTMRRFFNLDYNLFIVSHEDVSKELTRNSGERVTRIAPNIQEAIANKLAGMVDFVARVVVKDDDSRVLSFKKNEVIFGGGRLNFGVSEIPLDWDELMKLYEDVSLDRPEKTRSQAKSERPNISNSKENEGSEVQETETPQETPEDVQETVEDEPPKRSRRKRTTEQSDSESDGESEETPKRSRRRRVTE